MAGQLKEVRNRIKSVQSTQQITKAMKMVSAAKLRRAQDAILQMRPYASKLQEMLSNIVSNVDGGASITLAESRPLKKALLIVITSDRGLCGAYNANIQKMALNAINERYTEVKNAGNLTIWAIGKKGAEFFQKRGFNVDTRFRDTFLQLSFEGVQACAQAAVQAYQQKEFDAVEIVYSEFKNAASQVFTAEQFLPIPKNEPVKGKSKKADFIFEPHQDQLIAELMPKILNTQLYKAVLDGKASENANELLKSLKISYNRARQAAITTELTEIVSGAAALQG
jgi:F-type H+-transporting ATPase subunit gamma